MKSLVAVLEQSEFFKGFPPEQLATLAGYASPASYAAGEHLSHLGGKADGFWLIQSGRVALGFYLSGRHEVTVATLSEGDVAGFSWVLGPTETRFDIVALSPVVALRFDGEGLRRRFDTDPAFGMQVLSRFTRVIADRVDAMSLQLLDVFGHHPIENQ